jgi:hypothetical protein
MITKFRRRVRLMADYGTAGLWDYDGTALDLAKLPLSPRLGARLSRWCDRFQASLDREIDLEAFAAEGRAIARAVKAEPPDWSIVYFDEAAAAREKYQGPPSAYEVEIE